MPERLTAEPKLHPEPQPQEVWNRAFSFQLHDTIRDLEEADWIWSRRTRGEAMLGRAWKRWSECKPEDKFSQVEAAVVLGSQEEAPGPQWINGGGGIPHSRTG